MNRSVWLIGVSSLLLALSACTRQEAGSTDTATDDTAPAAEQPGTTTDYGTGAESTTPTDPNATTPPADTTTTPPPADSGAAEPEPGAATTPPQ